MPYIFLRARGYLAVTLSEIESLDDGINAFLLCHMKVLTCVNSHVLVL